MVRCEGSKTHDRERSAPFVGNRSARCAISSAAAILLACFFRVVISPFHALNTFISKSPERCPGAKNRLFIDGPRSSDSSRETCRENEQPDVSREGASVADDVCRENRPVAVVCREKTSVFVAAEGRKQRLRPGQDSAESGVPVDASLA
eukprot:gnl/TRDRNA2_/TRDRNA2_89921_c0_seq1.p2 gnl/TRDRNA2_/TRDRNA2_89921_c0~~gnl/TRDRNA2_/TRDRNA2_89921_c0_seq1.p2  ORF type:complete len:149 (-),score=11.21 gnl/TRDRNA2_/TRDRNA2_89921_c0_seq1:284-730(-)